MSDAAVRAIARALATAQLPGSGLASQQVAHAAIVTHLRALGLDAGTARVLADRSQAAEFHPGQALSPALDRAHARAATTRAAYLVGAAKRLADRRSLARLDQQATERRHLNRHVEAQQAREQAAQRVDGAASMYGPVLGWWAKLDDRTTPKCRHHHGANFRADAPPALGLPGETHGGNCRCIAGPPHPRGPRLTPAPADAPAEEVAMSRGITLTDEQARERLRAGMDYIGRKYGAIELANKKLADGNEVTESGLHYNPKNKTFRPATEVEKDAAGKTGGDFNSKHPRAAAGSPAGGQFVPLGTARDDKAAAAQKDKGATDAYQSIGSAMVANRKTGREKIHALSDDVLGKLTRVAYSSKTSDPKVVALRMALAAELRSRGKKATDFGALGLSRADAVELATSSASLDASPRKNWVENSGGLPRGIRKVARALKQRYPAWPLSRCIAVAISRSKVWAAGGSAKGARNTAEWTALKARNAARTATSLSRDVELARHKPYRYRHGWIPLRPGVPDRRGPKARGATPDAPKAEPSKRTPGKGSSPKATGKGRPARRASPAETALAQRIVVARREKAKPGVIARLVEALRRLVASRRAKAQTSVALARTTDSTGDIEMAGNPGFGGKTPTRNDVKSMVQADRKVPGKLKPAFRKKVMGHARNCKSEDCIPNHWRGGNPDKPGQTTSATASTPPGKKVPFGGKKAAPFGAKKS